MPDAPDPTALAHVRSLLAGGYDHQAFETALAAAARRGLPALDGPTSVGRFLLAIQAAAEELEGIGAALAEGADGTGEA